MDKEKEKQLKMSEGKAGNILRRKIMYHFLVKLGLNDCYKCGKPMTLENHSIEHKDEWLHSDNPSETYFDIDNIAFSHKKCNRSNRGRKQRSKLTKYKGVHFNTTNGRKKQWIASLTYKGKKIYVGSYMTDLEAAIAYDKRAVEVCGDKFITNKKLHLLPETPYSIR